MKILVRDLEPVMAAVKKLNAPILTTSRAPVAVSTPIGNVKAIMFRDPDGYIVEAVQAQAPADARQYRRPRRQYRRPRRPLATWWARSWVSPSKTWTRR
jgi:hypothetical protein